MKKTVLTCLLLVAAILALPACGMAVPSKQDALDGIRQDETAREIAQIEADGRIEAAKIAAEAQRDAAGLQATAVTEAAALQATAVAQAASVQAQAVLAAGSGGGAGMMAMALDESGAAVKAVDLLGAWVSAGAPETDSFEYVGRDGNTYEATFDVDIQPLFTENNVWFEGQQACTGCHFGNTENSYHEMSLASHEGILLGGDVLSEPPGVSILGESSFGAGDFSWDNAKLRERLRNNRMPPGWEFDLTETNRDGPCLDITADGVTLVRDDGGAITYGCDLSAVGLIGAWVTAGAPETDTFDYGSQPLTFARDVQPFFTQPNMWYEGSQACTGCHFGNTENSYHEMDLSTYQGILTGPDSLSEPPGVPILGQSEFGATDYNWGASTLRARLRNNRMAPGVTFDITEENRDGPWVLHGKPLDAAADTQMLAIGGGQCGVKAVNLMAAWVTAGAPDGNFDFVAEDGSACQGVFADDVQPLFSENNVWFEGQQACTGCHFGNTENSYHEMSLASHQGILLGGDVLSEPPGVSILGESSFGAGDFSWDNAKLRERLRNNRMPPGWEFDISETNRDGPCLDVTAEGVSLVRDDGGAITYGCDLSAVGLIGAWVTAGAPETDTFDYGDQPLTFARDVQPFFTQPNMWYEGSQACTGCHFGNTENSYHEMDLSTYQGILTGPDSLSEPPGVPILGQSEFGATDYNWGASTLRARLRNNRMAPGVTFDITEENRDGPMILAGTAK